MGDTVYDMPISEVARFLDKSDRQVRRYVKARRLKARPVRIDGHIKLMFNRVQVEVFRESLLRGGAFGESGDEIVVDARLIGQSPDGDGQEAAGDDISGAREAGPVRYVIDALKDQLIELQTENRQLQKQLQHMSGLVGFHQGRAEALQDQLRALMPAQPSEEEVVRKRPWYRRMFRR